MTSSLELYTARSASDLSPLPFQYSSTFTGNQLLSVGSFNIGLPINFSNVIKFINAKGETQTIDKNKTLSEQCLETGMVIFILSCDDNSPLPIIELNTAQTPQQIANTFDLPRLRTFSTLNSNISMSDESTNSNYQAYDSVSSFNLSDPSDESEANSEFGVLRKNDFANNFGLDMKSSMSSKSVTILTYNGFRNNKCPECTYFLHYSFDEMSDCAKKFLGIHEKKLALLLRFSEDETKWFEPGHFLEEYNPFNQMSLSVFTRKINVKINTKHFQPKLCVIEIMKPICEIIPDIAKELNIESYDAYSLFCKKNHDSNSHELLNDQLCLPVQTNSLRELFFIRRFPVFTKFDLMSFDSALLAFNDARETFLHGSKIYYIEAKTVIILTSYSLVVDPPDGFEFDFSKIHEKDISSLIPQNFANDPTIKDGIATFFDTREKPNRGDAIRLYLKFVRLIPSFGHQKFKAKLQIHEKEVTNYIDCSVIFCPQRLIITISDSISSESEIYYHKIDENVLKGHKISIKYRKLARLFENIVLRSKYASEIYSVLSGYYNLYKKLLKKRAIEESMQGDDDVNDNSIVSEENQIGLYTYSSRAETKNPQIFMYDMLLTGRRLISQVVKNLNADPKPEYRILLKIHDTMKWVPLDESLMAIGVDDGMSLYLIEKNARVKIHFTDESTKMVIFDVSKQISELVKTTFQKLHLEEIIGYTFYTKENRALDVNFSIPEQCEEYSDLFFKRRFFILTSNDLTNTNILRQTFSDTRFYVLNNEVDITNDQAMQLALLSLIVDKPKGSSVDQMLEQTKLETLFPKYIKINSKFQTAFLNMVNSADKTIEDVIAMRRYIKIARELPKFGAETVKTQFKLFSKNKKAKFIDGLLLVCPLFLALYDNQKKEIFKAFYHQIIDIKSAGKVMALSFNDQKTNGQVRYIFKSEFLDDIILLISETIGTLRQMIIKRQNEKANERISISQRLEGGWVDENGCVRRKMTDMFLSTSLKKTKNLPIYWFEIEITKEELLARLIKSNKFFSPEKSYSFLAKIFDEYHFLRDGESIAQFYPNSTKIRKFLLFVIESFQIIKIGTSLQAIKSIRLPVESTIKELIPIIADKFSVSNCIGYTLFHSEGQSSSFGKDARPLELNLSLPEQMSEFTDLYFKRRFFVITQKDYAHMGSMLTTFNDVRELVLSGKMDVSIDNALQLAYYALYIDLSRPPSPDDVPKDIQSLLPANLSPKANSLKALKNLCQEINVTNKEIAIRKYLKISRDIPTFGCEPFSCSYLNSKNKNKQITVLVGPSHIYVRKQKGAYLLTINYDYLLDIESIFPQIAFKYITDLSNQPQYFIFDCDKSSCLVDVVKTYIDITNDILKASINGKKSANTYTSNMYRINIITEYQYSNIKKNFFYDRRFTGLELSKAAARNLRRHPLGKYSCLLDFSTEDKRWVDQDQYLGCLHPYKNIVMHLFETNMLINIKTADEESRKIIIDITQPVSELVPFIADRLFVSNWIGYCLYSQNNEPLDFQKSVPEQINDFSNLIFKRRIYRVTENDIASPTISTSLLPDFKRNVFSSLAEPTKEQVINFAVCLLITAFPNREELCNKIINDTIDLSEYLPYNHQKRNDLQKHILTQIKESRLNKSEAVAKFLQTAQKTKYFGYEKFHGIYLCDKLKQKHQEAMIMIGPEGIKIHNIYLDKDTNVGYSNIHDMKIMRDKILFQFIVENKEKENFLYQTNSTKRIYNLINAYKNIIIPLLDARNKLQIAYSLNTTDISDENTIVLPVAQHKGYPQPMNYSFNLDFTSSQLINLMDMFFLLINSTKSEILFCDNRNQKMIWLEEKQLFGSLNPSIGDQVFYLKINPSVKILLFNGLIISSYIQIQQNVYKNVQAIMNVFKNKMEDDNKPMFYDGYTLYPLISDQFVPLKLDFPLPNQTDFYTELLLKRRFYVFSVLFFENDQYIFDLYEECKEQVIKGTVEITEEEALLLGVISIFADKTRITDTNSALYDDISPLLPRDIVVTAELTEKFQKTLKLFPPNMTELEASCHYIIPCVLLRGFGCEFYDCFYTDLNNSNKRSHRIAKLSIGPFLIDVNDSGVSYRYATFSYPKCYSCYLEDKNLHFKFHDAYDNDNHIMLEIEKVAEAYEYYVQMCRYLNDSTIVATPTEIIEQLNKRLFNIKKKEEIADVDINIDDGILYSNPDYHDDTYYNDFITSINIDTPDAVYEPQLDYDDDHPYEYVTPDPTYFEDENDDYVWRISHDGLIIDRAGRCIDDLSEELQNMIKCIDTMDCDTLLDRLAAIEGIINILKENPDISDEFKAKINLLENLLDEIRDIVDKFAENEGDMGFYVGVLTDKFSAMVDELPKMKQLLKAEIKKKLEMKSGKVEDPLVKNLLDISGALEELSASLARKLKDFNGNDPFEYISSLHAMSERMTALASSLDETKDPKLIDGSVRSALSETVQIMKKLHGIGIRSKFSDNLMSLLVAVDQMIANTTESRNRVAKLLYYGDNKAIEASIAALIRINKEFDELILPKEGLSIDNYSAEVITSTKNRILETENFAKKMIEKITNDPTDVVSRCKALYALIDAEELAKHTFNHISERKIVEPGSRVENLLNYLDSSIKAISTINIVPSNISSIIDNIVLILNKHSQIDKDLLGKICNQTELNAINESITILKDVQFNIEQQQIELNHNFLNYDILKLVQSQILKIRVLLPKLKITINALEKTTKDPTFSVILERLLISLNTTLCEKSPTETFENAPHLEAFIQAQYDLGIFISIANNYSNKYRNMSSNLLSSIQQSLKRAQNSYLELLPLRQKMFESPFNSDVITSSITQFVRNQVTFEGTQNYIDQITEETSNFEFQRISTTALQSTRVALSKLRNSPKSIFRIIPNMTTITSIINDLSKLVSTFNDNSSVKPFLIKQIQKLNIEKENPSDNFFRIIQRVMNKLMKVPSQEVKENLLLKKVIDNLFGVINYKTTLDDVKNISLAAITTYQEFISVILQDAAATSSSSRVEFFKSWEIMINHHIDSINSLINDSNVSDSEKFDYQKAQKIKEIFLTLHSQLPYIPIEMRIQLEPDRFELLAKKLGLAHANANRAINCIRNLPTVGTIQIDGDKFNLIKNEDELSESFSALLGQVEILEKSIEESLHLPQIVTQQNTQKLIAQTLSLLSGLDSSKRQNINEKEMIVFLNNFKQNLPFVQNSVEMISPIIGSRKLPDVTSTISQNAIILLRYLTSPHMNIENGNIFIRDIKPVFKSFIECLNKNNNIELEVNVNKMLHGIADLIKNNDVDIIKLRKKQILCDELYINVTNLLPELFDVNNVDSIIDELLKIYEITDKFTSVQNRQDIKFTGNLTINKQLLSSNAIENIVKLSSKYCRNDMKKDNNASSQSNDFTEAIIDNLSLINDHQEGVPSYILNSVSSLIPSIKNLNHRNPASFISAARSIVFCNTDFGKRLEQLTSIAINTSIRAAMVVDNLKSSLIFIEQQITNSSQNIFSEFSIQQFELLQHSLSLVDTKLLIQCKSLPTSALVFLSMQEFENPLHLFLDSVKDIASLRSILLSINESLLDFCFWLNETELSIASVFLCCLDLLVCKCEENKEKGMMPFIRKVTRVLLSKERLIVSNKSEICELSRLYLHSITNESMIPKETKPTFTKLAPVVKWWANLQSDSTSSYSALSTIFSQSIIIHKMLEKCKDVNIDELAASFSVPKSKISSIIAICSGNNSINKELLQLVKALSQNISNNPKNLFDIDNLLKIVQDIQIKTQQILKGQQNKLDLSNLVIKAEKDIELISDVNYLAAARSTIEYLKKLVNQINSLPIIENNAGKDGRLQIIEKFKDPEFLPIQSYGSLSFLMSSPLSKSANVQTNNLSEISPLIYGTMKQVLNVQKLMAIRVSLLGLFPDSIKMFDSFNNNKSNNDEFDYTLMYIEQQFDAISSLSSTNPNSLKDLQMRYSLEQVVFQQFIISNCLNSCSLLKMDSPKISKDTIKSVFEIAIKSNHTIEISDIDREMLNCLSLIRLISQLVTLFLILPMRRSILKYVQTPEGQQYMCSNITAHEILENQQIIQQMLHVTCFPELIRLTVNQFSVERILTIMKIIRHSINLIVEGKSEDIPDAISIFRSLSIQQQLINKENPNDFICADIFDILIVNSAHRMISFLVHKYIICSSLLSVVMINNNNKSLLNSNNDVIGLVDEKEIENLINIIHTQTQEKDYNNVNTNNNKYALSVLCLILGTSNISLNANSFLDSISSTNLQFNTNVNRSLSSNCEPFNVNVIFQSQISFDSLLQSTSHLQDCLFMTNIMKSKQLINNVKEGENNNNIELLRKTLNAVDEYMNKTHSATNNAIQLFIEQNSFTEIASYLYGRLNSLNINAINKYLNTVIVQSQLLNKLSLYIQQQTKTNMKSLEPFSIKTGDSKRPIFNFTNLKIDEIKKLIVGIRKRKELSQNLTMIYESIEYFNDEHNSNEFLVGSNNIKIENIQIEKQIELLCNENYNVNNYNNYKANCHELLLNTLSELTSQERIVEKAVIASLINVIESEISNSNDNEISLSKYLAKIDINSVLNQQKQLAIERISFAQLQQIILAEELIDLLAKTANDGKSSNENISFGRNEIINYTQSLRFLIGFGLNNVDFPNMFNFTIKLIDILVNEPNLNSVNLSIENFDLSSQLQFIGSPLDLKTILTKYAHSIHSLLYMLRTYSQLPVEDCSTIFITGSNAAISLFRNQINSKDFSSNINSTNSVVNKITDFVPSLVASMIRIVSTKGKNINASESVSSFSLNKIIKDPILLLPDLETLLSSSIDEKKNTEFKKMLLENLSKFTSLQTMISNEQETNVKEQCFNSVADLINAIDKIDFISFNYSLIELEAIHLLSTMTQNPQKNDFLDKIWAKIQSIIPLSIEAYSRSTLSFTDGLNSKAKEIRPLLVEFLNKETRNPFKEIDALTSSSEIHKKLEMILSHIEILEIKLLNNKNDNGSKRNENYQSSTDSFDTSLLVKERTRRYNDILYDFTLAISAFIKCIESFHTKDQKVFESFFDIMPTVVNSIFSLNNLLNAKNKDKNLNDSNESSSVISQTAIRRAIRPFKRILHSLLDQLDDYMSSSEEENNNKSSAIYMKRIGFMSNTINLLKNIILTVSTSAVSPIIDTFSLTIKEQVGSFSQTLEYLKTSVDVLVSENVDRTAFAAFEPSWLYTLNLLQEFYSTSLFMTSAPILSSNESQQQQNQIKELNLDRLISDFSNLIKSMAKTVNYSYNLTDIRAAEPDFENAARLPNRYLLPHVPIDSAHFKLQENVKNFSVNVNQFKSILSDLDNLIKNSENNNNKVLVDSMISLISVTDNMLQNLLRATTTTLNLKHQTTLAMSASTIAANFSAIVKSLRDKLLLSGDWTAFERQIALVLKSIDESLSVSAEASKVADQEDSTRDQNVLKLNSALKILNDSESSLNEQRSSIEKMTSSIGKEWSTQMINIGVSLCSAIAKILLYEKDKIKKDYQYILSFSDSISMQINEIGKVVSRIVSEKSSETTEKEVSCVLTKIAELGNDFAKTKTSSEIDSSSQKEENALKEGILTICRAASSVAQMANETAEVKNNAREKKKVILEQQRFLQAVAAKEKFLKRLELESKVIKARIILERSEMKLAKLL